MTFSAIVLAGGRATRATHLPKGLPKALAKVNSVPVAGRLLDFLIDQGASSVTFILGHGAPLIHRYLQTRVIPPLFPLRIAVEDHPAGTVGAVRHALATFPQLKQPPLVLVNGDTLLDLPLRTIVTRYSGSGVTVVREEASNVMTGVRVLGADAVVELLVSSTRDVEDHVWACDAFTNFVPVGSFVDVGTPEGYERAQKWVKA